MMPETAVEQANAQFYTALSLADLAAMQRLWLDSPEAVCTHPGWRTLQGWEAIRESWVSIFAHQGPLRIWPSEVQVRVFGQTAEVRCLENIDSGQVPGAGLIQTHATNVFRRAGQAWKLLEHHAAPRQANQSNRLERFSHN